MNSLVPSIVGALQLEREEGRPSNSSEAESRVSGGTAGLCGDRNFLTSSMTKMVHTWMCVNRWKDRQRQTHSLRKAKSVHIFLLGAFSGNTTFVQNFCVHRRQHVDALLCKQGFHCRATRYLQSLINVAWLLTQIKIIHINYNVSH